MLIRPPSAVIGRADVGRTSRSEHQLKVGDRRAAMRSRKREMLARNERPAVAERRRVGRAERLRYFGGQTPLASFGPLPDMTESLNALSGVMRAFFDALILIVSPVAGLRPMRAGRSTFTNLQKPDMFTGSPLATTAVMTSWKPLRTASASFEVMPVWAATAFTSCLRFIYLSFTWTTLDSYRYRYPPVESSVQPSGVPSGPGEGEAAAPAPST